MHADQIKSVKDQQLVTVLGKLTSKDGEPVVLHRRSYLSKAEDGKRKAGGGSWMMRHSIITLRGWPRGWGVI